MADDASEIERALRLMEPKEPKELKDSSGSDGYVEGGAQQQQAAMHLEMGTKQPVG